MIIASSVKKEISIPLQPISTVVPTIPSSNHIRLSSTPQEDEKDETTVDFVTVKGRQQGQNDFIIQVFGQSNKFDSKVEEILTIQTTTNNEKKTILFCEAFIHNNTVFLSSPFVGHKTGLLNWADGEFQSCITHLIELAEEKTGCNHLIVCINKHQYKESLNTILRAFMYLGFEMMHPIIYGQEPEYVLVGYEL
ncbi:uncharacterized protein BX663DRAFT_550277 [Cokeromyces recurvatus]|uniref:uncharacterized protein n=1 Tax=Cokeromyces recurvatus TaxID=90255 RepID=UPI0022207E5B|nr:uncharacterized protein BX663DRAFT_550277 [Cokeromyces recurvatus]KAI7904616.1 hypothetical protein BX663DRAFT_550277 [Cokeromyces recurvatus]